MIQKGAVRVSSVFPGLELGDEVSEVMHADNCSVLKIENETARVS